jgi:hypothetical protein
MAQRAYLDERARKDGAIGYRVRWRLGGVGGFQTETFAVERKAERFLLDVEDAGLRWPAGWVKGLGRVAAPNAYEAGCRCQVCVNAWNAGHRAALSPEGGSST